MIRHLRRQRVCFAVVDAASAQAEYPATKCIFLTCEKSKCDGVCGAGHLANGWGFISFLPYAVVVIIAHWSVQSRRRVLCRRDFSDIFVLRPAHSIFHFGMFAQIIFTFGCVFAIKVLHVSIRAKNTKTCNKFANGFNFTTTTANVSMAHSVKMSHSMCSPFSTSSNFFSILYLKCASLPHLCVQAERVLCYEGQVSGANEVTFETRSNVSGIFLWHTAKALLEPFRSIYDIYLFIFFIIISFASSSPSPSHLISENIRYALVGGHDKSPPQELFLEYHLSPIATVYIKPKLIHTYMHRHTRKFTRDLSLTTSTIKKYVLAKLMGCWGSIKRRRWVESVEEHELSDAFYVY